jgi:hypothetical protein
MSDYLTLVALGGLERWLGRAQKTTHNSLKKRPPVVEIDTGRNQTRSID